MTQRYRSKCKHVYKEIWEDHILMGNIFYGHECVKCKCHKPSTRGSLELGVYK